MQSLPSEGACYKYVLTCVMTCRVIGEGAYMQSGEAAYNKYLQTYLITCCVKGEGAYMQSAKAACYEYHIFFEPLQSSLNHNSSNERAEFPSAYMPFARLLRDNKQKSSNANSWHTYSDPDEGFQNFEAENVMIFVSSKFL